MRQQLARAVKYWGYIAPICKYPKNKKEYNELVSQLDELLEFIGDDEKHQLMGLVDLISNIIQEYENQHYPNPKIKGIAALKFLMNEQNLVQKDLSEIASQGVLSEILSGKRPLNVRQIKLLSKRFHVSPETFFDD